MVTTNNIIYVVLKRWVRAGPVGRGGGIVKFKICLPGLPSEFKATLGNLTNSGSKQKALSFGALTQRYSFCLPWSVS